MKHTGYQLSRAWFNFCFDNPEKITPTHTALYFFAVEHCNRLGWKEKFNLPTEMTKEAIGIKSWHTYIKAFNDIVDWGFFILIERSKNQFSSNIIALSNFNDANSEALDKATTMHVSTHESKLLQSNDSIYKLITDNLELITKNMNDFKISLSNLGKDNKLTEVSKSEYIAKIQGEFFASLKPFEVEFGPDVISKFYNYWSEPNKSMTKIKQQLESTWDTKKRLTRWVSNNFDKPKKSNQSQIVQPDFVNMRKVEYTINGAHHTHYEKAYLENLHSLGPDKVKLIKYLD